MSLVFLEAYMAQCLHGFAFLHNKPENRHYHIYLFGVQTQVDSIRKTIGKYITVKYDWAVKTTAGGSKNLPLDPRIAYQYAMNPDSFPTRVWVKGLDDETIERFDFGAHAFYAQMEKENKSRNKVLTEVLVINNEVQKVDKTWERLINELIENPDMYNNHTIPMIKSKIAVSYLKALKAVPRQADLHRYAFSLFHIKEKRLHTESSIKISDTELVLDYS